MPGQPRDGALNAAAASASPSGKSPDKAEQEPLPTAREPVAIVGIGCRFTGGVSSADQLWQWIEGGADGIGPLPRRRRADWPLIGASDAAAEPLPGGYLAEVDRFDAEFFGIAPREALCIDPQHRLALEVAWEALEDAGLLNDRLSGSACGVFLGVSLNDFQRRLWSPGSAESTDRFSLTGSSPSLAAGRIAHLLGLRGPALVVDTACSSSLVAVHLACASLGQGDCDLAIAGGVNLILDPAASRSLADWQVLSPDGRCHTFAANATGYGRAEGCGIVVLKRYRQALSDRDRIRALVLASAVNHDGRSAGLTVPQGLAQAALLRQALDRCALKGADIDYLEAHGSGTPLGDPLELKAALRVLGDRTADSPRLRCGSVKANLGHTEAAAGIAGLLKTVLALEYQKIPPQIHARPLNPAIVSLSDRIEIPEQSIAWPRGPRPRRAGVSSFGFSGTNAHVILEEPPVPLERSRDASERPMHLFTLSAQTPGQLCELALRYAQRFEQLPADLLPDICYTAGDGRRPELHRLAVITTSLASLTCDLRDFATRQDTPRVAYRAAAQRQDPAITWRFPEVVELIPTDALVLLIDQDPTFRETWETCLGWLPRQLQDELVQELRDRIRQTDDRSEALAAAQYLLTGLALARTYCSWGIRPPAITGRGLGSRLARWLTGRMPFAHLLEVSPHPEQSAARDTTETSAQLHWFWQSVPVPQLHLDPAEPQATSFNSDADLPSGERKPARSAADAAVRSEIDHIRDLRLGRSEDCPAAANQDQSGSQGDSYEPTLIWHTLLKNLSEWYLAGGTINWVGFDRLRSRRRVSLPTYPFLRQRHWPKPGRAMAELFPREVQTDSGHPLLGVEVDSVARGRRFRSSVSTEKPDWQRDHGWQDSALVAGATMIEMALAAGSRGVHVDGAPDGPQNPAGVTAQVLSRIHWISAMPLSAAESAVQTSVGPLRFARRAFRISSRLQGDSTAWRRHCQGWYSETLPTLDSPPEWDPRVVIEQWSSDQHYRCLAATGWTHRGVFRGVAQIDWTADWARARLAGPDWSTDRWSSGRHPAFLDCALQVAAAWVCRDAKIETPVRIVPQRLQLLISLHAPITTGWCLVRKSLDSSCSDCNEFDFWLTDDRHRPVLLAKGLRVFTPSSGRRSLRPFCRRDWISLSQRSPAKSQGTSAKRQWQTPCWRVIGDSGTASVIAAELRDRNCQVFESLGGTDSTSLGATDNSEEKVNLVYCVGPTRGTDSGEVSLASLTQQAQSVWRPVIETLNATMTRSNIASLTFVTCAAQILPTSRESFASPVSTAGLIGYPVIALARIAARECHPLPVRWFDLEDHYQRRDLGVLVEEFLRHSEPREWAIRRGRLYATRLTSFRPRSNSPSGPSRLIRVAEGQERRPNFAWMPQPAQAPAAGEVLVRVETASLRDLAIPDRSGADSHSETRSHWLGSGVIVARGEGVVQWSLNERVLVVAPEPIASFLLCPASELARQKADMAPTVAACLPTWADGPWAELLRNGVFQNRAWVLIQDATKTGGQIAIRLARQHGSQILATASTARKCAYLKTLQIDAVLNSRSPRLVDEIRHATRGAGVDLAIDQEFSSTIEASLASLAKGGRLVRLSRGHIGPDSSSDDPRQTRTSQGERAASRRSPFWPNLATHVQQDWSQLALEGPHPLPVHKFSANEVETAFHHLKQRTYVGQLSISPPQSPPDLRENASYMVVGANTALAPHLVDWLVQNRAGLVWICTNGGLAEPWAKRVAQWNRLDCRVRQVNCEVLSAESLRAALKHCRRAGPRLAGVFYLAGESENVPLRKLNWDLASRVIEVNLSGAWNLHQACQDEVLDFFVTLTSTATWGGASGQACDAIGNAFLESLAVYRRQLGLPGVAIASNSSPILFASSETQPLSGREDSSPQLSNVAGIDPGQTGLALAMKSDLVSLALGSINWCKLDPNRPEFTESEPEPDRQLDTHGPSLQTAHEANPEQALLLHLSMAIGRILGNENQPCDLYAPLPSQGLDSLMALEIIDLVRDLTGRHPPGTLLSTHQSVYELATYIRQARLPSAI